MVRGKFTTTQVGGPAQNLDVSVGWKCRVEVPPNFARAIMNMMNACVI